MSPSPTPSSSLKRPASEGRISPPLVKRRTIITTTTTSKTISNFFKPQSQKEKVPEKITWAILHDSLITAKYTSSTHPLKPLSRAGGEKRRRKIAAFDFDSTLISTKSGLRFARDAEDWKWWNPVVPTRLRELYEQGYQIAVVSNQAGIIVKGGGGKKSLATFKQKATAVFNSLDLPMLLCAATERDRFRKPRMGMWEVLVGMVGEEVDVEGSLFVGDAAGRKGDFSCSDRDFASNINLPFHTPEEFFLSQAPLPFTRPFSPQTYLAHTPPSQNHITFPEPTSTKPTIILFVGSPGSGKSSFYTRHLAPLGYVRINQDTLKSRPACLKAASQALSTGSSIVIDNTNPDAEVRRIWIDLARRFEVPIRCVWFTAEDALCRHNDAARALSPGEKVNPEGRSILPMMAFTGFRGRFKEPRVAEGFADVVKVDFVFEGGEREREVWGRYWI